RHRRQRHARREIRDREPEEWRVRLHDEADQHGQAAYHRRASHRTTSAPDRAPPAPGGSIVPTAAAARRRAGRGFLPPTLRYLPDSRDWPTVSTLRQGTLWRCLTACSSSS